LPFGSPTIATVNPPQFYSGRSVKGIHVFIVNTNDNSTTLKFDFVDVPGLKSTTVLLHDMWTLKDLGTFSGSYNITLTAHDTAAFLVTSI